MKLKWVLAFESRQIRKITLPIQASGKNANSAEEIFVIAALPMAALPVQRVRLKGRSHPSKCEQAALHGVQGRFLWGGAFALTSLGSAANLRLPEVSVMGEEDPTSLHRPESPM